MLTGRVAVLAIVLAVVLLALALPLKVYLSQRAAIGHLAAQTKAQSQRVAQLKAMQHRWNDPAYVAAQARERLHYVFPGETAYVVLGNDGKPLSSAGEDFGTDPQQAAQQPWYSHLWASSQAAARR